MSQFTTQRVLLSFCCFVLISHTFFASARNIRSAYQQLDYDGEENWRNDEPGENWRGVRNHQNYEDLLSLDPSWEMKHDNSPRRSRWAMPASGVTDSELRCPPGSTPHSSGTHCVYDDEEY